MRAVPITEDEIPKVSVRESAVSTGLFREFLASDADIARVDTEGSDKKLASTRSTLQNYVNRHELPVKVFTRGNDLYLRRIREGNAE